MTTLENSEQIEPKKDSIWKLLPAVYRYHKRALDEYNALCTMETEILEGYTAYCIPTPPKDEPFRNEFPDEETNPRLADMREVDAAATNFRRIYSYFVLGFFIILISFILWINIPVWLHVVGVLLVLAVGYHMLWKVGYKAQLFAKQYAHVASLAVLDPDSGVSETWWNFERWKKWAMARYDFESEDELMDALESGTLKVFTDPVDRLITVRATGQEWPLRS